MSFKGIWSVDNLKFSAKTQNLKNVAQFHDRTNSEGENLGLFNISNDLTAGKAEASKALIVQFGFVKSA